MSEATTLHDPEVASNPVIAVDDLVVRYRVGGTRRRFAAVDGVTFEAQAGRTLGIIGESGSGKSTIARALVGLEPVAAGRVRINGRELGAKRAKDAHTPAIQMVFQDPHAALNPRMSVFDIIADPIRANDLWDPQTSPDRIHADLRSVGLDAHHASRSVHQLSGGQKQRVNIARALVLDPSVVVLDEAVSALDLSIQADVINLLLQLQNERGLTYVFITHDLGVVRHVADTIAVMYLGQVVEQGPASRVALEPSHPYTEALLIAEPKLTTGARAARAGFESRVRGEIPSALNPPSGCRFRTRCAYAQEICARQAPPLVDRPGGVKSACHFADELNLASLRATPA